MKQPQPLRVAVADDEPEIRDYLKEALPRLGHEVVAVASTGRELVDLVRATAPDLVITDIKMPDMDGIDAAVTLYKQRPVPVILVSAFHDAELIARAEADHIMGYLVKPIKQPDLEPVIILAMRRQGREARLLESCAGVDLRCAIDPFRMEQVFRNVLENALAACRDPVEVTVSAAADTLDGQPALRVAVRDNGPGLNAEQRKRIFEPFYTTKTKGTGLGMAIAKRIVEAHGGRIAVGPAARGAEILLLLPRGPS